MPKATTKIRRDKYGIFVRTDGHVYRPYGPHHFASNSLYIMDGWSHFREGDPVYARHMSQSAFAKVVHPDNSKWKEYWQSHGCYLNVAPTKDEKSEFCVVKEWL